MRRRDDGIRDSLDSTEATHADGHKNLEAQQVEIMALNSRMTQMEGMMTEVVTRLRQLTMHLECLAGVGATLASRMCRREFR